MLRLKFMPERTRRVYEALAKEPLMKGFVLIGGTALSLQLGHRLSEDLDFWLPEERMSKEQVDVILSKLGSIGFQHELVTPAWKITQAKINGIDLLSQSRDHVVDRVKVTFFSRVDVPYRHFAGMKRIESKAQFSVADKDTIFNMKSWLISQRVRSRDLYDLMVFVQRGRTLQDILDAGAKADPAFQREYAKEILVGNVPIDSDDEGFDSIGLDLKIEDIHKFFLTALNEYETRLATSIVESFRQSSKI